MAGVGARSGRGADGSAGVSMESLDYDELPGFFGGAGLELTLRSTVAMIPE